jgi:hypothetical protein
MMHDTAQAMHAHFAALHNGSLSIDEYALLLEQRARDTRGTVGVSNIILDQRIEVTRLTAANE